MQDVLTVLLNTLNVGVPSGENRQRGMPPATHACLDPKVTLAFEARQLTPAGLIQLLGAPNVLGLDVPKQLQLSFRTSQHGPQGGGDEIALPAPSMRYRDRGAVLECSRVDANFQVLHLFTEVRRGHGGNVSTGDRLRAPQSGVYFMLEDLVK